MFGRLFLIATVIAAALITHAARSFACAVCLSGDGDSVMQGYNASVLFLMATPYLVVASIAGGLVFAYRRALKRREEADEESHVLSWKQEDGSR
jgi:hypothetical protein